MSRNIRIVAISGSARANSHNTQLLRSMAKLVPSNVSVEIVDGLKDLPFYDDEMETSGLPEAVVELRKKVNEADAVLIATPEYNYSITGLLKNAIDWLSRPYSKGALAAKPVAITGASPGAFGTVRAQAHLRQVLHGTNSKVVNRPEVYVGYSHQKFGPDDSFLDDAGRAMLIELLDNLVTLVEESATTEVSELAS